MRFRKPWLTASELPAASAAVAWKIQPCACPKSLVLLGLPLFVAARPVSNVLYQTASVDKPWRFRLGLSTASKSSLARQSLRCREKGRGMNLKELVRLGAI